MVTCENEEALNHIISDYERRMNDMEKYHTTKNEHLQLIIDKLHQEREQLFRNK